MDSNGFKPIEEEIHIEYYEDETEKMRAIRMESLGIAL